MIENGMSCSKVAFYCCGNFTPFFIKASNLNSNIKPVFYVQNFKGMDFIKSEQQPQLEEQYRYLFSRFNEKFGKFNRYKNVNYNSIYQADKNHYKRYSGEYVEQIINTCCGIFSDWIKKDAPEFIFFPIIESLDAMALYEVAKAMNIKTIVYSHSRVLPLSFLSPDKFETFPRIKGNDIKAIMDIADKRIVKDWLVEFQSNDSRIENQVKPIIEDLIVSGEFMYDGQKLPNPIVRFFRNINYKFSLEKHNQMLRNFTKLQVFLERFIVPLQRYVYLLIEKFYLKPIKTIEFPKNYNYFALHFSPESSINTPSPYYVDQLRVIDQILLETDLPLIIREHPSVYGKRPLSFYYQAKKRPSLYFASASGNYQVEIDKASTVYTVTGTVAIECFLRGQHFKQFGKNYLSSFLKLKAIKLLSPNRKIEILVATLFYFGRSFAIFSPTGKKSKKSLALYSKKNIENFNLALNTFIKNQ